MCYIQINNGHATDLFTYNSLSDMENLNLPTSEHKKKGFLITKLCKESVRHGTIRVVHYTLLIVLVVIV